MDKYNSNMPSETFDTADYRALESSQITRSLMGNGMRFDSTEDASVFFARELDYIKAKAYDKLYPELTALSLFPISSEVHEGAETITYYAYEKVGMAQIISNYATDLPRADVKGKPSTAYIKGLGASYGYSIQEMRASRYAGKSLDIQKAENAKYSIDVLTNKIAWAGDEENGLMGVLSIGNNVPIYTPALNATGTSTRFKDKTPDEILADFSAALSSISAMTMGVERPDMIAIAEPVWVYLATTPRSPLSDKTILMWLKDNLPSIKDIVRCPELNAGTAINPNPANPYGDLNVMFLFTQDAGKFTIEMPLMFYQHPMQPQNLEIQINCDARTAGAIIYYPMSMLIIPGV